MAEKEVSKVLKITFLVHFVVAVILGFFYLFLPDEFVAWFSWPYSDPVAIRLLGAAFLGLGISSALGSRESDWEKVKIVVVMEIVWLAVAFVVMLLSVIIAGTGLGGLLFVFISVAFLGLFIFSYFQTTW